MKKTVEAYVSVWNTQQTERLDELFQASAHFRDGQSAGSAIDLLKQSIPANAEAFPDMHFKMLSLVEHENRVTLEWEMNGTNTGSFFGAPATDKKVTIPGVDLIEFENGKISSIKSFFDSALFVTQLGLQ